MKYDGFFSIEIYFKTRVVYSMSVNTINTASHNKLYTIMYISVFYCDLIIIHFLFIYYYLLLLDFIYRGSLFSIFTTLIYQMVLINNKTEQDTEQDNRC